MRKYLSSLLFIASCLVFAHYNALSIIGQTNTWAWHLSQLASVALFLAAGFCFGGWFLVVSPNKPEKLFHDFGRIVSVALLGIPAYVFTLHYWLEVLR